MIADNDNGLRFLSVCSGIEAASVAFEPLGWQPVAFSEIEKFPSAVLAHHYPKVPNLGDFTKIDTATLGRVDILCGGTPCQSFSVAGLRGGLNDARGNLTLAFVELAHELSIGNGLRNIIWENVCGVLSDKTNAFGCFLAGLVGADTQFVPPGGRKWTRHGMVAGPKGRAAWAVKDGQFFGIAQRRRRVLVVADFGNGADPAAVLFEPESVCRNPPARGEAGQSITHPVAPSLVSSGRGIERTGDTRGQDPVVAVLRGHSDYGPGAPTLRAKGGDCAGGSEALVFSKAEWPAEVAPTLNAHFGEKMGLENQHINGGAGMFVPAPVCVTGEVTHSLTAEGHDASEDGSGRGAPIVCVHADAIGRTGDAINPSLDAAGVSRIRNPGIGVIDDGTSYNLMASGAPHAIAFSAKDYGADASFELSPTLRADGHTGSHANGGCMPAVTVALRGREGGATAELGGEVATALRASQGGGDKPHVLTSAVRRLTPVECERLQGFPDGYTDIPWRGKPNSPDGPRYKALGNSWAVPKFTWLGRRIQALMPKRDEIEMRDAA